MSYLYDAQAIRKATNLTLNSDLVKKAKNEGINISQIVEVALSEELKKKREQAWLEENQDAIRKANEFVAEHGLFNDGFRTF